MAKSKIIVIEGTDGSGKATQTKLLMERLEKEGCKVFTTSFPNYESNSSALVKMYLNGEITENANGVSAKAASVLYAADRYITYKKQMEQMYNSGDYIMIFDRYTDSNVIHHGCKLISGLTDKKMAEQELQKYIMWLYEFEYEDLGIPKPNAVIYLNVPIEYTERLRKGRKNKFSGEEKQDIHESDIVYLRNASKTGLMAADMLDWYVVECVKEGEMRTIEDISEEVYNIVKNII